MGHTELFAAGSPHRVANPRALAVEELRTFDSPKFEYQDRHQEKGFALVALVTLLPLCLSVALAFGTVLHVLKRKSLAQAICIQEAMQLQESLKNPLRRLMAMNSKAQSLRIRRLWADQNLARALATGIPGNIAAAQAIQTAVIAQQLAFRAKQELLLAEAALIRAWAKQRFYQRAVRIGGREIRMSHPDIRALAVRPQPPASLSPDYVKLPTFRYSQQQRYRFRVDLMQNWPLSSADMSFVQTAECAVTLKGENQKWDIDVIAAKAPLS